MAESHEESMARLSARVDAEVKDSLTYAVGMVLDDLNPSMGQQEAQLLLIAADIAGKLDADTVVKLMTGASLELTKRALQIVAAERDRG